MAKTKRSVFYLLSANAYSSAGRYDCALQDCKAAIKIDTNSAMAWRSLGYTLLEVEQVAEAEQALARSLKLQESPTTCIYLCAVSKRQGDLSRAEAFCRQAIALSPEFDEAHYNLGLLHQLQGHLEAASRSFLKAISLSPSYSLANRELGAVYLDMGNKVEAQKHLKLCLDHDPTDKRAKELLSESTT
jgi:tetratricopeptide (TPR) repeat protein